MLPVCRQTQLTQNIKAINIYEYNIISNRIFVLLCYYIGNKRHLDGLLYLTFTFEQHDFIGKKVIGSIC